MSNCGWGACTANDGDCAWQILNMVKGVIEGVGKGIGTVMSFGASTAIKSAAKMGMKAAMKGLAKGAAKKAMNGVKKLLGGKGKKYIMQKAKSKVKEQLKGQIKSQANDKLVTNICDKIFDKVVAGTENNNQPEDFKESLIDKFDVFGVGGIVKSCKDTKSDGGLACAQGVVEGLADFDPTGLLTIAAAFIKPSCDVPVHKPKEPTPVFDVDAPDTKIPESTPEQLTIKRVAEGCKANCICLFSVKSFRGDKKEICSGAKNLGDFDDKTASIIMGKDVHGIAFEDENYGGMYLPLQKGTAYEDIAAVKIGKKDGKDLTLAGMISSVYIGYDPAVILKLKNQKSSMSRMLSISQTSSNGWGRFRSMGPISIEMVDFNGSWSKDTVEYLSNIPGNKKIECLFNDDAKSLSNGQTRELKPSEIIYPKDFPKTYLVRCKAI